MRTSGGAAGNVGGPRTGSGAGSGRNLVIEVEPQPAGLSPGGAGVQPAVGQRPPAAGGAAPSQEKPRGRDEHIGLRFWVEVDGVRVAGFCECSPITIETETFDYSEGGLNTQIHRLPVRTKYGNITLKRGLDPGQDMFKWFMATLDGNTQRKNVTISIYGPQGSSPVEEWHLRGAYPVKWNGPDLKTETGAIAIETLEFAYESLVNSTRGGMRPGAVPPPPGQLQAAGGQGSRSLEQQQQNQQMQQQIQQQQQMRQEMRRANMQAVGNLR